MTEKSDKDRRRNYAHIRYMMRDIGLESADVLSYAGNKYGKEYGALESIKDLDDWELDDLISSLRAYLDINTILMMNPAMALSRASAILSLYQSRPVRDDSGL